MTAIDLNKQQALHADPKAIQQINFTRNLKQQVTIFFINEGSKYITIGFSQGTVKAF